MLLVAQSVKAWQADEETEDQAERAAVWVAQAELTQDFRSEFSVQKAAGVGVAVCQWEAKQEAYWTFVSANCTVELELIEDGITCGSRWPGCCSSALCTLTTT